MEKKVIAGSYTGPKDREAYKLGYKKKSVPPFVKRIAVSWLVFLIVGVMLGVGITAACLHRTNPDGEGEEQIVEAPPVYGTRDGHVYVSVSASRSIADYPKNCRNTRIFFVKRIISIIRL